MAARLRLSCLVFAVFALSLCTADEVFLSIDCGSSSSYTDENLISWSGDDSYVGTGESRTVNSTNSLSRVMDTLRVFTTRKKNCYHIDSMRPGRVLVRASFYYGNYDGKSLPPSFNLMLDGNPWMVVQTSMSDSVSYEVIYVMKTDSISVCVAQTKEGQFPFMSALEVRRLEPSMYIYINDTYPLFTMQRSACGANSSIRFPNDPYDRLWTPLAGGDGLITLSGNITFNGIAGIADNPPPAVLQNAIAAVNPNSSINLNLLLPLPRVEITVYINFYFSEVARLGPNDKRSFRIFVNNLSSTPIIPLYANMSEMYISNYLASSSTRVSLVPTNDTTLPPLINALELFLVGPELSNGTDKNDVHGLALLQNAFDVLKGWGGDPCLPAPYSWDWINCSNGSMPRVTSLHLGSYGLSGMLPDLSSMDALETIDLHNNSVNGPIPDSLGKLPNLKELNLADNKFSGSIPTSLSQKNGLNLVVTGNPNLCTPGVQSCAPSNSTDLSNNSSDGKKEHKIFATAVGVTISLSFVIMEIVF